MQDQPAKNDDTHVNDGAPFFSVVTFARNAGERLETYFQSLTSQSLDFTKNIQLIIVVDASDGASLNSAEKWQRRYPVNIRIVRPTDRSGCAIAAHNAGMAHIAGRWATFIANDGLVPDNYFTAVKQFLDVTPDFDGNVISCMPLSFNEATKQFLSDDPLNYKYARGTLVADVAELPEFVQCSIENCFLRVSALQQSALSFDAKIPPSFADEYFLYDFLVESGNTKIAFIKETTYIHRKCSSPAPLDNRGWEHQEKFREQILFGYTGLLRRVDKKLGNVPAYIQYAIIYEVQEYVDRMLNSQIPYAFTADEVKEFFALMRTLFIHIETEHILFSRFPMLSWRSKIAMLCAFKKVKAAGPLIVQTIAPDRRSFLLVRNDTEGERYAARRMDTDQEVKPLYEKTVRLDFLGTEMGAILYRWFPLHEAPLRFIGQNGTLPLLCGNKILEEARKEELTEAYYLPITGLPQNIQAILEKAQSPKAHAAYADCWLLMDRVDRADDNAEHLYRWLSALPERKQKIYFVLSRTSPDWERLRNEGFHLLAHKSQEHLAAVFHAEWVISSHVHHPLFDPLGIKDVFGLPRHKFAFLPHGITQGDISKWLDPMPVDLFITTGIQEHASILQGKSRYMEREVKFTGFPRQDSLLALKKKSRDTHLVLLCPTWRDSLCNPHTKAAPGKAEAAMFMNSDYFTAWNALTKDEEVATLAEQYGYRFIFFPHPYVSRNVGLFEYSRRVIPRTHSQTPSIQALLAEAALLVTDYSSMAFEAALLGTSVAYYQFAESPAFFSSHTYSKGYFDYTRDGFGPVLPDLEKLKEYLNKIFSCNCKREEMYTARAEKFFPLRDGQNCRRVYDELQRWGVDT
ncbi:MAG: bifunctional glycosyltransferase family 2 protein/CDP-glycerol:glycerophosphate glycerophosphotransferase [Desulfovibrio sp.]|jgi:glycosyltransferase involved in cell wall biosynthesis|nr:bifunctional glycosyltransferase family 2 protein/CDP-glycerol:glycerophosphate glycerophosphotransferase [Desulfovibrio sp.]